MASTVLDFVIAKCFAQEAYSALGFKDSENYDLFKNAVLKAYELVPGAYWQRFRGLSKSDKQTCVKFAKEKETYFTRWCQSQKAETTEELRQLFLVEDFKN